MSEEAKKKIGLSKLGKKYALGCKRSVETRRKISIANLGNTHALGNKLSDETKQKMSKNTNALGCKRSEETRRKISTSRKGYVCSEESRKIMSIAQKLRYSRQKQAEVGI